MSNVTPSSIPAGWYPDPAGTPRQRWWDGGAWTEHYNEPPVAAQPEAAQPYGAVQQPQAYGAVQQPQAYGATQQPYAAVQQPYSYAATAESLKAPAGIPVYNLWIWLIVSVPVISTILSYATTDWTVIAYSGQSSSLVSMLVTVLTWAIYGLSVFFAFRDWKTLAQLGVPRPFHWAWAFLGVVYPIGRSIVVRRRTGHGMIPFWITIGYLVATLIAAIVIIGIVVASVASLYGTIR